jgi:hypothetical protein
MGYLLNSGTGYNADAVTTGTTDYAYLNTGYSSDAVTIPSEVIDYLYVFEGYEGAILNSIEGAGLVLFLQLHD